MTSIGENFYCALAKGPLVQDHVLLIPVEHLPNTLCLSADSEIELGKFQNSLKMYYKNQGKEAVFFEWISKRGTHANLQVKEISLMNVIMELHISVLELVNCLVQLYLFMKSLVVIGCYIVEYEKRFR